LLVAEKKKIIMKFRRMAWIGFFFGVAVVSTAVLLAHRPPTTNCNDLSWLNGWLSPGGDVVFASKLVIQPWYARHHVIGVFVIPDQYRNTEYTATVIVRGVKDHFELSSRPTKSHQIVIANVSDRFVKHVHIQTRIALWFLLTGHFGDLRATCNWALVLTKKKP
jgi:hypothetical protein